MRHSRLNGEPGSALDIIVEARREFCTPSGEQFNQNFVIWAFLNDAYNYLRGEDFHSPVTLAEIVFDEFNQART